MAAPSGGARHERKRQTRQALLDAALAELETRSFSSLSLRRITSAAGIVPTAFYRHFADMEELGLELVSASFETLRQMLREARRDPLQPRDAVESSVRILVSHVHRHRKHFRFIVRERYSGVPALRGAIRWEIRLFVSELATDLARFPVLSLWSTDDLRMLAELLVNAMVATIEAILEAPPDRPGAEERAIEVATKQLRLILVGVPHWRSS